MAARRHTVAPSALVYVIVHFFLLVTNTRDCASAQQQQRPEQDDQQKDERIVLQMGRGETMAELYASWRALHQEGYSCWLGAREFNEAVCILVGASLVCWKLY